MNNDRRVVITGLGVVTPVGNDLETFWSNLKNGVSGIRKIEAFDASSYDCQIAGDVRDFDPKPFFKNPKDVRRTDRFAQLALAASKMALDDAGIDVETLRRRDRFGVIVSSGIGGLKTLQDQQTILLTRGPSRNSPFTIPMLISNMASGIISMEYGLRGPNICIVTACATSNNAIGESWRIIKFGDADIFLAGGSEASIVPIGLAGFSKLIVGGITESRMASAHAAISIPPAPPNKWPVIDLVELTDTLWACSPNTCLIARVSQRSPMSVEVACALM